MVALVVIERCPNMIPPPHLWEWMKWESLPFIQGPYCEFLGRFLWIKRRDWMDTLFVERTANCAFYNSGLGVRGPRKPLVVLGNAIATNRHLLQ